MYALVIMLMFNVGGEPQYKSPPVTAIFGTLEECERLKEPLTDAIKADSHADHVIYACTKAAIINTGAPA